MSRLIKISARLAIGSFSLMIALAFVGHFLESRGSFQNGGMIQWIVPATAIVLFGVLGFSLIPLMVHAVLSFQVRAGNAELPPVKLLLAREKYIIFAMWGLMGLGSVIALPAMYIDTYGLNLPVGKSQGTLVADIGMLLDDVEKGSTLKLVPRMRVNLDGSHQSIGDVVFDFQVAGSEVRFEQCRYYFLTTYPHDNMHVNSLNVGISPHKLSAAELQAAEWQVRQRLLADHWVPGHFVYKTPEQLVLHGGATTGGEGRYWAKNKTLLILSSKRMDDAKPGEDPKTAGEFIQVIDLVPRDRSSYADLVFSSTAIAPGH